MGRMELPGGPKESPPPGEGQGMQKEGKKNVHPQGFEPWNPKILELESSPLDRSGMNATVGGRRGINIYKLCKIFEQKIKHSYMYRGLYFIRSWMTLHCLHVRLPACMQCCQPYLAS